MSSFFRDSDVKCLFFSATEDAGEDEERDDGGDFNTNTDRILSPWRVLRTLENLSR